MAMADQRYEKLTIKFESLDASAAPLLRCSATINGPGGQDRFELSLPESLDAYQQAVASLVLQPPPDEMVLRQLGNKLFQALFGDPRALTIWQASRAILAGRRLRIILEFEEPAHPIAALPWEALCDPADPRHVMLTDSLVRFPWLKNPVPITRAARPLRVLLTAAQTGAPARMIDELDRVRSVLDVLGHEQVSYVIEPHLTYAILQNRLREGFHIWHFVGHGEAGVAGPRLLFEDDNGDPIPQSADDLSTVLAGKGVGLVLFSACESGRMAGETLQSLPLALLQRGVPAVVAMQFMAYDDATREFAEEFYKSLAGGMEIDHCVTEGRIRLMNAIGQQRPDWCTPVLYTRSPDARLVDPPPPPRMPADTATALRNAAADPCARLSRALIELNYKPQGSVFGVWMNSNVRAGAFLIHGGEYSGHRWLVKQLMLYQGMAIGQELMINFGALSRPNSVADIWDQLEKALRVPGQHGAASLSFAERARRCGMAVADLLREKNLQIIVENAHILITRPAAMQEFLDNVWHLLAAEAVRPGGVGSLLLFLLARKDCSKVWQGLFVDTYDAGASLTPVRLPVLPERFSEPDLVNWWESNRGRLPAQLAAYSPDDWWQDSDEGRPERALQTVVIDICGCQESLI